MSCKYNNCKHCGYKSECEIYKENAELEKKISVLLSCKNCPDNKGGLLCQKEYEDKCLAQKIQYIKELKEENAELKKELEVHDEWAENFKQKHYDEIALKDEKINYLSEQIQELKIELDTPESVVLDKLDEAKDLLKRFIETNEPVYFDEDRQKFRKLKIEAEDFLKDCK